MGEVGEAMNKAMDRRGSLKAMLYLAGAAVLPLTLVEPVRATIAKPSRVPTRKLPEYGLAVSYSNHSQILSQFDPDDPTQIQLRKQMKCKVFQWEPDASNAKLIFTEERMPS